MTIFVKSSNIKSVKSLKKFAAIVTVMFLDEIFLMYYNRRSKFIDEVIYVGKILFMY